MNTKIHFLLWEGRAVFKIKKFKKLNCSSYQLGSGREKKRKKITKIFDERLRKKPPTNQNKPNHPQNKKTHRTLTGSKKASS